MASLLLLAGAGSVHDATALGDSRTLTFHHTHSDENLTVTFKRNGRYDEAALQQINHFLRDWRSQDQTTMDRRLFDILWEVYRDVDGKQPIQIISAYRSPATNAMLRRRSSGVARASQHMLGHAMDFYIPGVPLEQIRFAGLRLQRGGVGFYPTSGSPFVHLDTGSIRHWPRMSHDQLARVFPDGRTVHVPSDGNPLRGYQLALADVEKRGNASDAAGSGKSNFLASLFGKSKSGNDEDDEGGAAPTVVASADNASPVGLMAAAPGNIKNAVVKIIDSVPLPRAKPAPAPVQMASADLPPAPVAKPAAAKAEAAKQDPSKPQSPADIINARGFWDDMPATKQATPAQVAAISARQALAAADPQSTATISEGAMQAMAYAPPPAERASVVAASAPLPRSVRPAAPARHAMGVNAGTTVVAKGQRGVGVVVATSSRLAAAAVKDNDVWMRAMILAPSASTMTSTVFGDTDLTILRAHFSKPQAAVAMAFADDPQSGMQCERFTGAAVAPLPTTPFMRTAALR